MEVASYKVTGVKRADERRAVRGSPDNVSSEDADKGFGMADTPESKTPTSAPVRESSMQVYLFVRQGAVRRFEALQRKTRHLKVVVAWDRRERERRQPSGPLSANRRLSDRRRQPAGTWEVADFTAVTMRSNL